MQKDVQETASTLYISIPKFKLGNGEELPFYTVSPLGWILVEVYKVELSFPFSLGP